MLNTNTWGDFEEPHGTPLRQLILSSEGSVDRIAAGLPDSPARLVLLWRPQDIFAPRRLVLGGARDARGLYVSSIRIGCMIQGCSSAPLPARAFADVERSPLMRCDTAQVCQEIAIELINFGAPAVDVGAKLVGWTLDEAALPSYPPMPSYPHRGMTEADRYGSYSAELGAIDAARGRRGGHGAVPVIVRRASVERTYLLGLEREGSSARSRSDRPVDVIPPRASARFVGDTQVTFSPRNLYAGSPKPDGLRITHVEIGYRNYTSGHPIRVEDVVNIGHETMSDDERKQHAIRFVLPTLQAAQRIVIEVENTTNAPIIYEPFMRGLVAL